MVAPSLKMITVNLLSDLSSMKIFNVSALVGKSPPIWLVHDKPALSHFTELRCIKNRSPGSWLSLCILNCTYSSVWNWPHCRANRPSH